MLTVPPDALFYDCYFVDDPSLVIVESVNIFISSLLSNITAEHVMTVLQFQIKEANMLSFFSLGATKFWMSNVVSTLKQHGKLIH